MKGFKKHIRKFVLGIIVGFAVIGIISNIFDVGKKGNVSEIVELSYNDFLNMIDKGKVEEVVINYEASTLQVIDKKEKVYETDNPRKESFKEFLLKQDIEVKEVSSASGSSLASIGLTIFMILTMIFLFRQMTKKGPASMMSQTKTATVKEVPKVKFDDIAGHESAKRDVQYLIDFLKSPKRYTDMGARMSKGTILYGPPGTGKTLLAKAIAGEAGVPFFSVNGADFVEMFVGVGARRVRELFKEARKQAPCIVFIDEMEAVGKKGNGHENNSEREQTIKALLTELDGFASSEGIIVIGATNNLESLDETLIRPGRFDKHIAVPNPDYKERKAILALHAKNKKLADDIDFDALAKLTIGFSGAGLETLLNESAILAVSREKDLIDKYDVDDAFYKVIMKGDKKSTKDVEEKQLELVAWHEGGHALVSKLLTKRSIPKVTIVPSTNGAGGVTFIIPDKPGLHTKKDLINEVKTLYAGRIAEYLLTNDEDLITTGASQDIKQATNILLGMVKMYGMSDEFGMLYVEGLSAMTDTEVLNVAKQLSKDIYSQTVELMTANKDTLEQVALRLLEKETIEEKELDEVIFGKVEVA